MINCPWQYLKKLCYQFFNRSRTAFACNEREATKGCREIDFGVSHTATAKFNQDQVKQVRFLFSLSNWYNQKLAKRDLGSERCPCGHHTQSWKHLVLDCPRTEEARLRHPYIVGLFSKGLPACMLNGILPCLPANPDHLIQMYDGSVAVFCCDAFQHYKVCWRADQNANNANSIYMNAQFSGKEVLNARQLMDSHRGMFNIPDLELPEFCNESPPEFCNNFSDGGVLYPAFSEYQLGGAGIVWPNRDLSSKPLHVNEELQAHETANGNVAIWGKIPGQRCDSTRAEIVGAIYNLSPNGGVHSGIDSLNTIRTALSIQEQQGCPSKKHFGLMANGDVLEVLFKHLQAKGFASAKFSKVLGHAKDSDVEKGKITLLNMIGNNLSDASARKGVQQHTLEAIAYGEIALNVRKLEQW